MSDAKHETDSDPPVWVAGLDPNKVEPTPDELRIVAEFNDEELSREVQERMRKAAQNVLHKAGKDSSQQSADTDL